MTTTHQSDAFPVIHGTPGTRRTAVCLIGGDDPITASVGRQLARMLGCEFLEGHRLHPAGRERAFDATALHDHDRLQWLSEIGRTIWRSSTGVVVVCPPISRSSRDVVRWEAPATRFIRLTQGADEPCPDVLDLRIAPEDGWDAIGNGVQQLLATTTTAEPMVAEP